MKEYQPKIEARPWEPQDLLDDLMEMITEQPDSYMNKNRDTLCMAHDYLKEHFAYLQTPFSNDPFSLVWEAFKNLYPGREFKAFYDQHQSDQHDEEYGFTHFPNDGSTPSVFIYAEHSINIQVETFAHELAHVAVGPEHEHDDVWEAAFDAIFKEYNLIGDEMFGKPDGEEVQP